MESPRPVAGPPVGVRTDTTAFGANALYIARARRRRADGVVVARTSPFITPYWDSCWRISAGRCPRRRCARRIRPRSPSRWFGGPWFRPPVGLAGQRGVICAVVARSGRRSSRRCCPAAWVTGAVAGDAAASTTPVVVAANDTRASGNRHARHGNCSPSRLLSHQRALEARTSQRPRRKGTSCNPAIW